MSIFAKIQSSIQSFFGYDAQPAKQPANTKKYVILHKKENDHLATVPNFSAHTASPQVLEFDHEHNVTTVNLTAAQAKHLNTVVHAAGDHIEEDQTFTIPPYKHYANTSVAAAATTATPGVLVDIPQYQGHVKGIDVIVLDTLIVTGSPQFAGYNVSVLQSFVGGTPCESHGSIVGSIIAKGFVPQNTDIHIKNVAVFDCNGSASTSTIVNGLQAILAYKASIGNSRKLVVNFSGGGSQSTILDRLFAKLPYNGIHVVVAAGNSGEICTLDSPARIASHSAMQSVGALGKEGDPAGYKAGQDLSTYSNYATPQAKCVNISYQGCYDVYDPVKNQEGVGCGTSFAAPVGTARTIACVNENPTATPMQVKQILQNDTVPLKGPQGVLVNGITPTMAFTWNTQKAKAAGTFAALAADQEVVATAEVDAEERARPRATA